MKKFSRVLSMALAVVLVLGLLPVVTMPALAAGYGSNGKFLVPIGQPVAGSIPISGRAELEAIANDLSGKYHLTNDIDLSGSEWNPIGNGSANAFAGTFDGQGYVISNLKITGDRAGAGLFDTISGATIKNVGLYDTYINITSSSSSNVGGICASGTGSINNCYNIGDISSSASPSSYVGGICTTITGTISNCYNIGDISASASSSSYAGGICTNIGNYGVSNINNCYNTGAVSASSSTITFSPSSYASGICSFSNNTDISNCFNTGDISASSPAFSYSGGICGSFGGFSSGFSISNCYNTGDIYASGTSYDAGGICGSNSDSINNCYWNIESVQIVNGDIQVPPKGVGSGLGATTSLTTEQMQQKPSFAGFDFNTVWDIKSGVNNGYPFLRVFAEDDTSTDVVITFPDPNFEAAVRQLIGKPTGDIYRSNVSEIMFLDVSRRNISDLTGLEHFAALVSLSCGYNQLAELDVSNNTELDNISCNENELSELDVSNNTKLTSLSCDFNQLTELDVRNNTKLTFLNCRYNPLSGLDVSNNLELTQLLCENNQLTELDVTGNTKLETLWCNDNQLTELDVSNNTVLSHFLCENNQLTDLDMTGNTKLKFFCCGYNQLTELDVSNSTELIAFRCDNNRLTELDLSNNTMLTEFLCNGNYIIAEDAVTGLDNTQVDRLNTSEIFTSYKFYPQNVYTVTFEDYDGTTFKTQVVVPNTAAAAPSDPTRDGYTFTGWDKAFDNVTGNLTVTATYSLGAEPEVVIAFPDPNFEAAVREIISKQTGDIYKSDVADITNLDVSYKNISNLTGIEHFSSLTRLDCESNKLTELDVSNNKSLDWLRCRFNELTELDVSLNKAITFLDCNSNQLTELDVSNNTELVWLDCAVNQLAELDVSCNTVLRVLHCDGNQLTELDVNNNTELDTITCSNNKLIELDVSINKALTWLHCKSNNLTELNVSHNTALEYLNCSQNHMLSEDLIIGLNKSITIYYTFNPQNVFTVTFKDYDGTILKNQIVVPNTAAAAPADPTRDGYSFTGWDKAFSNVTGNLTVTATYSLCAEPEVVITFPDSDFEAAVRQVIGKPAGDIYKSDVSGIAELDVNNKNISDLTGIEYFTALTWLDCRGNNLTELDVGRNTTLTFLNCSGNQLAELDVSNNVALTEFLCSVNLLTELDVSNNTELTLLVCNNNYMVSEDLVIGLNKYITTSYTFAPQNVYTVTFKDYNGTTLKTQIVVPNTAAAAPSNLTRDGYTFAGWDKAFDNVTGNLTVTATYSQNPPTTYTVTFVDYDGTTLKMQTIEHGSAATAPADPSRVGYDFSGWSMLFDTVTESMFVIATYTAKKGAEIIDIPGDYERGNDVNGDLVVAANDVKIRNFRVTGNVTINGRNIDIVNMRIDGDVYIYGSSVRINNCTVSGSIFIFATDVNFSNSTITGDVTIEKTVADGNVTLKGVTAKNSTIYVKGGGANSVILEDTQVGTIDVEKSSGAGSEIVSVKLQGETTAVTVKVRSAVSIVNNAASAGSALGTVELTESIPQNTTVVLSGAYNDVSVMASDIVIDLPQETTIETVTVTAGVSGSLFSGNGTIETALINTEASVDFENEPVTTAAAYTVVFDGCGGSPATQSMTVALPATTVGELPTAPARPDYRFTGWNTLADGKGTEFKATTPVSANITVCAQWTADSNGKKTRSGSSATVPEKEPALTPETDPELMTSDSDVSILLNTDGHTAYISGKGDGTFAPNDGMTRGEAAQLICNLLRDKNVAITKSFVDVSQNAWYYDAVGVLASLDVITGMPDGSFKPGEYLTRAQFAAIAVKLTKVSQGSIRFNDVSDLHWAYQYINTAANFGWVTGVGGGNFEPDRPVTRAEAVTLMNRVLGRSPDKERINAVSALKVFTDVNNSHWSYYDIMDAVNEY